MQLICFVNDKLDFWSLQFYRRLACRTLAKVASFDNDWSNFVSKNRFIPLSINKITKIKIDLDSFILNKTIDAFDLITGTNFYPEPNSKYSIFIRYTAISKVENASIILSMNFYGKNGEKDFEQKHANLIKHSAWQELKISLSTSDFSSEDRIKFRLWNRNSDPGTTIRIHSVYISKEIEIVEELSSQLHGYSILSHMSDPNLDKFAESLDGSKSLAIRDIYDCKTTSIDISFSSYCLQKTCDHIICKIIKPDRSVNEGYSINDELICRDSINIPISFDINHKTDTDCILTPISNSFRKYHHNRVAILASTDPSDIPRISSSDFVYRTNWTQQNIGVLVISEPLNNLEIRQIIIKCWSLGIAVLVTNAIPKDLQNGPISQHPADEIMSAASNVTHMNKLRELGYIAARIRKEEDVIEDIRSLVFNRIMEQQKQC